MAYSSSDNEYTMLALEMLEADQNDEGDSSNVRLTRRYIRRDHHEAHDHLIRDYFVERPKYSEVEFKLRFRMRRHVFNRIMEGILNFSANRLPKYFEWFHVRTDCRGELGISTHLKITMGLHQLAYGYAPDALDEYLQMSECVARESLQNFCKCITVLYSNDYMREPTREDMEHLYEVREEKHDFPGMLGSIDCMHWVWGKCPVAWQGQFKRGDHSHPTIMLEAVASYNWIWHAYFGVVGSKNDINVLNTSPLFESMLNDNFQDIPYVINGVEYKRGYYLADRIYPQWASFVKAYSSVADPKSKYFSRKQSKAGKDVERTFGILQGRWHILQQPARAYSLKAIQRIIYACIIMHNMIVEDNGFNISENNWVYEPVQNMQTTWYDRCEAYKARTKELHDREVHERF
ncbi:uncharacterized protein [Rutidosis leptorrhynchoides]|uniref:uncharacterized protein n=1 Tax=Rutidosis leptorrhynchoides TaxID=125765 RepID=UPI003A98F39A